MTKISTTSIAKKYPGLKVRRMSDITEEKLRFVWYPYVPIGVATLLFGKGGLGKSWLTCSLAADISQGRMLPGPGNSKMPPQKVLMITGEDDPAAILIPRMKALGANMENIYVTDDDFILDKDGIANMKVLMREVAATVVFLDTLMSYLGPDVDMNRANETRNKMKEFSAIARETGCAVVLVHHSRKNASGRAADQAMGSADFSNSVRSAIMVDRDTDGQHFMEHVKHNYTAQGPTLAYKVADGVFQWAGSYTEGHEISKRPRAGVVARNFLSTILGEGEVLAPKVEEMLQKEGISIATVNKIKPGFAYSRRIANIGWVWGLNDRENDPKYNKIPFIEEKPEKTITLTLEDLLVTEALARLGRGKPSE